MYSVLRMILKPDVQVELKEKADWWLGQLDGPWFSALESAVQEEWGVAPLRIREGGVCYVWLLMQPVTDCTHSLSLPSRTWRKNLDVTLYIFQWDRAR